MIEGIRPPMPAGNSTLSFWLIWPLLAERSRVGAARAVSLPMARLFRVAGRWQTTLDLLRAAHATVQPASTRHAATVCLARHRWWWPWARARPARSRQEVACQRDAAPWWAVPHHDQLLPATVDVYVVRAAGRGRPGLLQQQQRWQQQQQRLLRRHDVWTHVRAPIACFAVFLSLICTFPHFSTYTCPSLSCSSSSIAATE